MLGVMQRAAILRKSCALFGPNGPPSDAVTRHQQLARFHRSQDRQLKALDDRNARCTKNVNKRLMLFAAERREHFVRDGV